VVAMDLEEKWKKSLRDWEMIYAQLIILFEGRLWGVVEFTQILKQAPKRIKRFAGGVFWAKRKRNIYSQHYKGRVKWEELWSAYHGFMR